MKSLLCSNGSTSWRRWRMSPQRPSQGSLLHYLGIVILDTYMRRTNTDLLGENPNATIWRRLVVAIRRGRGAQNNVGAGVRVSGPVAVRREGRIQPRPVRSNMMKQV